MGRTAGSTTLHPDWELHLWMEIRVLCETKLSKTGRKLTPRAAAKVLEQTGGLYRLNRSSPRALSRASDGVDGVRHWLFQSKMSGLGQTEKHSA